MTGRVRVAESASKLKVVNARDRHFRERFGSRSIFWESVEVVAPGVVGFDDAGGEFSPMSRHRLTPRTDPVFHDGCLASVIGRAASRG